MYLSRKYLVGGVTYTPYLPATAGGPEQRAASTAASTASSKEDPIKKEIIGILKENGIPSDVDYFLQQANSFLTSSSHLSTSKLFGGEDEYDLSDLIKIQSLANRVKFNKELYNNAAKRLTDENAWAEVAVDNKGLMYVLSEEGLTKVTPSELYSNPDKYSPITNSALLSYRENNQPFDNTSLNNLSNAVGMETITKYLTDIISKFGKGIVEGYSQKDADKILGGFNYLMENGPDGYYKATSETDLRNARRALDYLYNALPSNMRNFLAAKVAAEGGDPKTQYRDLLVQALTEHTSYTARADWDKETTDYDPFKTGKAGGSGLKTDQLTENDYLQRIGNLRGMETIVSIFPRASKIAENGALTAHAYKFGTVINRQKEPVPAMSLTDLKREGWAFAAGEPNDVVFGNKLLTDWEQNALMFDPSSNLTAVMLPYKNSGGHIVPDFDKIQAFNKLQQIIKDNPLMTSSELNDECIKLGISPSDFDRKGNVLTLKDTMAFLSVSCYAGDDTIDLSKDETKYLEPINKQDGKHIMDLYNNLVKYGKLRPAKKGDKAISRVSASEANDFWKGNIFIAMPNAFNAMNLSTVGEYVTKGQESNFRENVMARQNETALWQYYQDNDPNYAFYSQLGQFRDE